MLQDSHIIKVAGAPFSMASPEVLIEDFVAGNRMSAVLRIGAVKVEHATLREHFPCPAMSRCVALHGKTRTMLIAAMTSARIAQCRQGFDEGLEHAGPAQAPKAFPD